MFDPRVQYASVEDKESARVIWNSTNIQWALDAVADGLPLKKGASPFFDNNTLLRKPNLNFHYSSLEANEFIKCKLDILYFADAYCQLTTESGKTGPIKLRKYQKRMLRAMQVKKYVIILSGRQIGKTTTTAIFLLWKILFHKQESVALLGDKAGTAIENLNKLKGIMYNLPFFLKPGIVVFNGGSLVIDNGSKIFTGPCRKSALVGKTLTCLYIDELDIPLANLSKELVEYALPTIAAVDNGQAIFSSTPSVGGIFKDIFIAAKEGRNNFYAIQVNWWEVPGRTLQWKQDMLKMYGKDAFNVQFNCRFLSSTQTIFNEDFIELLNRDQSNYVDYSSVFDDSDRFNVLDVAFDFINAKGRNYLQEEEPNKFFKIKKDANIDWQNDCFIIVCDLAEGLGADDTVFNFFRININLTKRDQLQYEDNNTKMSEDFEDFLVDNDDIEFEDMFEDYDITFEQVALFKSNVTSLKVASYWLRSFCIQKMNSDNFKISVEYNKYGESFLNYVATDSVTKIKQIEIENIARTTVNGVSKAGVHLSSATKALYVPNAKSDLETFRILVNEQNTITQMTYFGRVKNSYAAASGFKDDITMTLVNLSAYIDKANEDYVSFVEDLVDNKFNIETDEDIW